MFTVGTGVGGGIVFGGRIYRGATGAAAELGHTIIVADLAERGARAARASPSPARSSATPPARALDALAAERGLSDGRGAVEAARARRRRRARVPADPRRAPRAGDRQRDQHLRPRARRDRRRRAAPRASCCCAPAREAAQEFTLHGVGTQTEIRIARYGARRRRPRRGAAGRPGAAARGSGGRHEVACGFDHAGVPLRETVITALQSAGHEPQRPRHLRRLPRHRAARSAARCSTARPSAASSSAAAAPASSVACCKIPGIRATVAHDHYTAAPVRRPRRLQRALHRRPRGRDRASPPSSSRPSPSAQFTGEERHVRRLDKVDAIERDGLQANLGGS